MPHSFIKNGKELMPNPGQGNTPGNEKCLLTGTVNDKLRDIHLLSARKTIVLPLSVKCEGGKDWSCQCVG